MAQQPVGREYHRWPVLPEGVADGAPSLPRLLSDQRSATLAVTVAEIGTEFRDTTWQ